MPEITNTYNAGNLLDWIEYYNDLFWTNEGDFVITQPDGNGSLKLEANASFEVDADVTLSHGTVALGTVVYRGEIDISNIPLDAIIKQIVLRIAAEGTSALTSDYEGSATQSGVTTVSINANTNAAVGASLSVNNAAEHLSAGLTLSTGNNNDSSSDSGTGPGDGVAADATSIGSDSDSIDFTAPSFVDLTISRADFIAALGNVLQVTMGGGGNINGSITFTNPGSATARIATGEGAAATSIELTNWELDITFETEDTDTPLVEETMDGGYILGGVSDVTDIVLIVDISGIYILVPGKRDDTWYDRSNPEVEATFDVKIPDPFVKLAFLPEDN